VGQTLLPHLALEASALAVSSIGLPDNRLLVIDAAGRCLSDPAACSAAEHSLPTLQAQAQATSGTRHCHQTLRPTPVARQCSAQQAAGARAIAVTHCLRRVGRT